MKYPSLVSRRTPTTALPTRESGDMADPPLKIDDRLALPHQGRGLMTQACDALLGHASRELGLSHFVIRAATENARSRAVAERLGFALMALRARAEPPARARSGDEAFYVLTRSNARG